MFRAEEHCPSPKPNEALDLELVGVSFTFPPMLLHESDSADGDTTPPAKTYRPVSPYEAKPSTERHAICGECLEIVFVDTDGNGGLAQYNPGDYQKHLHQVLTRRSVT